MQGFAVNLESLISQIQSLDGLLKHEANKAVNRLLTIRNWLIGYYIVEQDGEDRARYGENILGLLSKSLNTTGLSATNLKWNRLFYLTYPNISQTAANELKSISMRIGQTLSDASKNILIPAGSSTYEAQLTEKIINRLSFSHIILLIPIDDALKRTFYAIEAIKGTRSVRELRRQINSLLFERSVISKKPELLLQNRNENAERQLQSSFIKDIDTFEFLGLRAKESAEETDLENALLDHLQHFLLEIGHGFCLEEKQKRILIGEEYFFIDMVFYHRILKCHILVDLKTEEFNHNNAGQLNTYVNFYKKEIQRPDDNPPIGILLVTHKNDALVEYATAGMDEQLFVRKYLPELPDKKEIEAFIINELKTF